MYKVASSILAAVMIIAACCYVALYFTTDQQETHVPEPALAVKQIDKKPVPEPCVKRLPKAIVIGVAKCGTTALNTFLHRHPQLAACVQPPEVHYFDVNYDKPLSWYREKMPCSFSNQITTEKTPNYWYKETAPHRIKQMNPEMKLVVIVKEPVTRIISALLMQCDHGKTWNFTKSLFQKHGEVKMDKPLAKVSRYVFYAKMWLRYFPLRQMWFVDGHKLETDPVSELQKLEKFLNVPRFYTKDVFVFNSTKGRFCLRDGEDGMKCLAARKGRIHPAITPTQREKLQTAFKPYNKQFFQLIGREFDWGY